RDDLLGVWASMAELGKTEAGDIYRRKKSLPILHALERASVDDKQRLQQIYQQKEPVTTAQIEQVMAVFERTQTRAYCRSFLAQQCQRAYDALDHVPRHASSVSARALDDLRVLIHFVETAARD
ncbi:MAG: polyprenyl synthetase family protein, partial [Ktedonobacteraceae bacterium]|nr:polyprenyl synthetase family protein [Ktedonobacteraceae bacterium]